MATIDEAALTRLIEYQIKGNVRLLVPCGTTGESATMTEQEDRRVIKHTIETGPRSRACDRRRRQQFDRSGD